MDGERQWMEDRCRSPGGVLAAVNSYCTIELDPTRFSAVPLEAFVHAIHQVLPIKDRKVVIYLPDDFPAGNAEVIVKPATSSAFIPASISPDEDLEQGLDLFWSLDISDFSSRQREAYMRLKALLRKRQGSHEPRELGLFREFVHIADDFDAPLPDEDAFEGIYTDEYGVSLER